MLFFLDARLLPPGRKVLIHGLASRPELNGWPAVIAGPRPPGTLRYPVRPLAPRKGAGHDDMAAMLLRPRNLRLLGDEDEDRFRRDMD